MKIQFEFTCLLRFWELNFRKNVNNLCASDNSRYHTLIDTNNEAHSWGDRANYAHSVLIISGVSNCNRILSLSDFNDFITTSETTCKSSRQHFQQILALEGRSLGPRKQASGLHVWIGEENSPQLFSNGRNMWDTLYNPIARCRKWTCLSRALSSDTWSLEQSLTVIVVNAWKQKST